MPKQNIIHICDYCGKEHFIDIGVKNKLDSGRQKTCCCSIECSKKLKENKLEVKCEYCGKIVIKKKSEANKNVHSFCSQKCSKEYIKENSKKKVICEFCGNEFTVRKCDPQRFCSVSCQNEWQKTNVGINNPRFTRISIKCTQCGKDFYIKRYRINDGMVKFCGEECRREWYSSFWSQQSWWKEESRKRAVSMLSSGKFFNNTNTKPQLILNNLLDSMNISYLNEYSVKYYSIDNYLTDYDLMIEVNGDYWHASPIFFDTINEIQYKKIINDKRKRTYVRNLYKIEILYIWEDDLIKRPDLCIALIKKYIECRQLSNYHSFNYQLHGDDITINDHILIPYQERDIDSVKKIKK